MRLQWSISLKELAYADRLDAGLLMDLTNFVKCARLIFRVAAIQARPSITDTVASRAEYVTIGPHVDRALRQFQGKLPPLLFRIHAYDSKRHSAVRAFGSEICVRIHRKLSHMKVVMPIM